MSLMAALKHAFQFESDLNLTPRYNIAPSDPAEILIENSGKRVLDTMLFGLIPHWAKDPKMAFSCLNARAESVAEKPAFRTPFKRSRGLVLADGFFEWRREGKVKTPFFIQLKSKEPFGMAGLWDVWKKPNGQEVKTFAIVTTEPNPMIEKIHNRMPVIVKPADIPLWLSNQVEEFRTLRSILEPFPDQDLQMTQVSTYMNNSRNKGPECIQPV
jgi:putative SOS response-associated peptidase YedK